MITTSQRIFTILFLFPAFCASPAFSQGERGRRDDPFDREEMLRRFDTDGDGELNNAEREKMRDFILESLQERPGGSRPEGGRPGQPPAGAPGGRGGAAGERERERQAHRTEGAALPGVVDLDGVERGDAHGAAGATNCKV